MAEQMDWSKLGFGYSKAPYNVRCTYKNGAWGELRVSESEEVTMHMAATVLHYGQAGFEGLSAARMVRSAYSVLMRTLSVCSVLVMVS